MISEKKNSRSNSQIKTKQKTNKRIKEKTKDIIKGIYCYSIKSLGKKAKCRNTKTEMVQ